MQKIASLRLYKRIRTCYIYIIISEGEKIMEIVTKFVSVLVALISFVLTVINGTIDELEKTTVPSTDYSTVIQQPTTPVSGTFTFTVYGYGHGVGMSQEGAISMAKAGSTYEDIMRNYYPGTAMVTDNYPPQTVTYGTSSIPLVEYLCRTTVIEIGSGAPFEALKAQVCAAYTFAKYYNFKVDKSLHAYNSNYSYQNSNVYFAVLSYLNSDDAGYSPKYVSYNGSAAFTCYFASAAGTTASAKSVWGGSQYPYLSGGCKSPENVSASVYTISSSDLRQKIYAYDRTIVLPDDPAQWLSIISHNASMSSSVGYVDTIRVGNTTVTGNKFRASIMDYAIRSHCFTFVYNP